MLLTSSQKWCPRFGLQTYSGGLKSRPFLQQGICRMYTSKAFFPMVDDPSAIKMAFKHKIDVAHWKINSALEPEEKRALAQKILMLNPEKTIAELFHRKPWDIKAFEQKHLPTVLGELKHKQSFSLRPENKYFLFMDMPIRLAGKGLKIPIELLQFKEFIEMAVRYEQLTNPQFDLYNIFLTVDQRPVNPGKSQRRTGWHGDSMLRVDTRLAENQHRLPIETDRICLVSDCIPTRFCPGPFPFEGVDPANTQMVLEHFEKTACGLKQVITHPSYTVIHMGPECIHEVGINQTAKIVNRTFAKITFTRHILNRKGNERNYLFDYNWPMHARNPLERNDASTPEYHPASDKYMLVSQDELAHIFDFSSLFKGGFGQAIKTAEVLAEPADRQEVLQTKNHMTANVSKAGDWKVTAPCSSQYFLSSEKMDQFYERSSSGTFVPKKDKFTFVVLKEKIKFIAPWGTLQYADCGDALVKRGGEIYAIHASSFKSGYEIVE